MHDPVITAGLIEICALVTDGTHDSPKIQTSGVPFIKGKHISSGRIDFETCDFITEEDHIKCIKRVKPQVGDVLFANIGSVGDVARVTDEREFSIKNIALFRPDPAKVDATYFYYLVVSPAFRGVFLNVRSGAAQPFISLEGFRSHRFPYNPDKTKQRRIGELLSVYDELMENNRRRMALLEEAARLLYREWFVRFRFPGHEHTRITNGVPEGWDDCRVSDFGQVVTGKTPITKEPENYAGDIPFIKTPDMHGNVFVIETETRLTEKGANTQRGKFVPPNTLLVSCIGTIGVVSMTSARAQFNQQINAVLPFEGTHGCYLFFALRDLKEAMEAIGGGATMGNVNKTKFEGLAVLKPATSLLREFHEFCAPLFQQIQLLSVQNLRLRTARDVLVPRLMSGEIAV